MKFLVRESNIKNSIYWPTTTSNHPELVINIVTLLGSLVGQLTFGFLADTYGRRKLYGLELIIVIVGTLGMSSASSGFNNGSMSILGWIYVWRFFIGIGRDEIFRYYSS